MEVKKVLLCSIVILALAIQTSCSKDSDGEENQQSSELLVGEWLFVSEHDYFCGTDNIATERFADNVLGIVYNKDGTFQRFEDGIAANWNGTWDSLGENRYSIYYTNDDVTETLVIDFKGNNTMNFGTDDECVEFQSESIYSFTVWSRH